jgi:hypothetical protein
VSKGQNNEHFNLKKNFFEFNKFEIIEKNKILLIHDSDILNS